MTINQGRSRSNTEYPSIVRTIVFAAKLSSPTSAVGRWTCRDEKGRIDGVRYDELAPILLNEVQKQAAEIRDLKKLVVEMQATLVKIQATDGTVARR